MSYWFHRNPLKATSPLTFELRGVSTDDKTRRIFSEMRQTRNKLLDLLTDPNHDMLTMEKAVTDYFSLLMGLIQPFEDEGENKLRRAIKFKWTNTLLGNGAILFHYGCKSDVEIWTKASSHGVTDLVSTSEGLSHYDLLYRYDDEIWTKASSHGVTDPVCILVGSGQHDLLYKERQDTVFEAACMAINVALWYTKHAAKIAAKEIPDMEEAKEVHKCLRIAAGIFTYVKDDLIGRLSDNTENGIDTDSRVLEAYISQCTAEAQEVTLARAIEMKHSASLVASLAHETSQLFKRADDALQSLDNQIFGKWRKYFQLKAEFYTAYAYCYNGDSLLAQDKCGEAVRGLQEGVKSYEKSEALCKEYAKTKGQGTFARPANHIFFRRLGPVLTRTLEKCERENGMIYHQKVAYDPPTLELKATYGLASPESYTPPTLNALWSKEVYTKMDSKMAPKPEPGNEKKEKPGELPPVKEKETPMSEKDPGTFSGCVVS